MITARQVPRSAIHRSASATGAAIAGAALLIGVPATSTAEGGEWDVTGFAGVEARLFREDPRHPGQVSGPAGTGVAQTELYWQGAAGTARFGAVVFGSADSIDSDRSHTDLREFNLGIDANGWDLNLGVNKVFWGVTESRHLVDVINQTDLVEDIDEEDKLGQPMINVNLDRDFGRMELYVLPRFRERTFPSPAGRLRGPMPIEANAARYESSDGKRHRDVSLRYSHYFGDIDFGAYLFDGTSREPRFVPAADGASLIPVYDQMRQAGIDVQITRDAWLWKVEAIARETRVDSFRAAVAGIEYTLFGAGGTAIDVGVLLEYLYDGRSANAPPTIFDNDAFLGARLALNDSGDTSILAGAIVDIATRETVVTIEAERRIGNRLKLDGRLRLFGNTEPDEPSYAYQGDDYLELGVSWYY